MLLLCASLQRQVFDEENKAAVRLMAGDNVEICRDLDAASFSVHNPVPDFIHCRYKAEQVAFLFVKKERKNILNCSTCHTCHTSVAESIQKCQQNMK